MITAPTANADRSPLRTIAGALGVAAAAGAASGGVMAAWVAVLNEWPLGFDALVLAAHLSLLYGLLLALPLGLAAVTAIAFGRRPGSRAFAALTAALLVLLNGLPRFHSAVQAATDTPHMTAVGVLDLVGLVACSAAAALAVAATGRRRRWALVALAAGVPFLTAVNRWNERPLERDLAEAVPAALASAPAPSLAASGAPLSEARLVLLAFDGLSWEALLPAMRAGELPAFRSLLEGAAYGHVRSFPQVNRGSWRQRWLSSPESISPTIWETISSGRSPEDHGIGHFYHYRFPGVSRPVRFLPTYATGNGPMSLRNLLTWLERRWAPWSRVQISARHARAARFYEIAERHGVSIGVFNWMNTGPVPPVDGFMRAFSAISPAFHPPGIMDDLPPLPGDRLPKPGSLDAMLARDRYERVLHEHFVRMSERVPVELLMFYTHFHDGANHLQWKGEVAPDSFFFGGLEHPALDFGELTLVSLRFLDDVLGDSLARTPTDATVVVLSDHGFDWREYKHHNGPPGVLIARGPGIRPGPFPAATIFDIAPTILHWLGLPVGRDMAGAPLALALPGGPLDRPVEWVESHGGPSPLPRGGATDEDELRRQEEYLRALGYVN